MSNYEPYNPNSTPEKKVVLATNRLFVVSMTIYALSFLVVLFQGEFGMSRDLFGNFFLILIITAFGINVVGFIKGVKEWNFNREMAINGIVGNLVPILVILALLGIGIYWFNQLSDFEFHITIPNRK